MIAPGLENHVGRTMENGNWVDLGVYEEYIIKGPELLSIFF